MKKSNILIAAFAVAMAAASAAKAGEIVDFDGKSRTLGVPEIFAVGQSYAQVSDLAQAMVPQILLCSGCERVVQAKRG